MITAFIQHHFQDAEHTGKFLVNFGGVVGLIGFVIFLIGLPFIA
jgi:hypothetical protein